MSTMTTNLPAGATYDFVAAPEVLRLTSVSKHFDTRNGRVQALSPVSLSIRERQFIMLLGPSGCGKTTLLNMVAGFDKPSSGQVLMDDRPVTAPGLDRMVMFQEHALFPWLSVVENVLFGLRNVPNQTDTQRLKTARHYIDLVGLAKFENAYIHEISGGMRQRVALARALAPHPRVLLMDEPFNALDAMIREELYAKLQEVLAQTGQTVLFVTHNVREAACLGDTVFIMAPSPGRILYQLDIPLPRPRDLYNPEVSRYAVTILQAIRGLPSGSAAALAAGIAADRNPESDSHGLAETKPARLTLLPPADRFMADGI